MWALIKDGKIVKTINKPEPITINNIKYPKNIFTIWSDSDLKKLGIFKIIVKNDGYDKRFYKRSGETIKIGKTKGIVTITNNIEARELEEVKEEVISNIKSVASSLLADSDWMVIREFEDSEKPVSDEWNSYRTSVRNRSNELETIVDECETVEEIKALHETNEIDVDPEIHTWPSKPE